MMISSSRCITLCVLLSFALVATTTTTLVAAECTLPSQRVQCGELTCNTSTGNCMQCTNTDQCWDEALECRPGDGQMKCLLKPYSLLIDPSQKLGGCIGAIFVTIIVCAIAVIAGVGGGGILTPLFQLLLGLPLTDAVAASQAAIVGQATFNMLLKLRDYHPQYQPPKPTRPVINYTMLCFWLPISLSGVMIGNLLGKMVPDWFRLTVLLLFLAFALKRMVDRFQSERKAEAAARAEKEAAAAGEKPVLSSALSNGDESQASVVRGVDPDDPEGRRMDDDDDDNNGGRNNNINKSQRRSNTGTAVTPLIEKNANDEKVSLEPAAPQYPLPLYGLILAIFVPLVVANIARNRWANCHDNLAGFWGITAAIIVYMTIIFFAFRNHLAKLYERICAGEEDPERIPFTWNDKTTIWFPLLSVTAGMMASLCGLGGGLVLNFLLLEAGLGPTEVSATGGFTTWAVALEALIQFVVQAAIRWDYFLVFFGAGILSTALGQLVLMPEIKKRGWTFLIIGALIFVMAASCVATSAVGIYDTVRLLDHGGSVGFGSICPNGKKANIHHIGRG